MPPSCGVTGHVQAVEEWRGYRRPNSGRSYGTIPHVTSVNTIVKLLLQVESKRLFLQGMRFGDRPFVAQGLWRW
jgi:hypothetical protein